MPGTANSADTLERESRFARLKKVGKSIVHFINPVSGSKKYYAETRKKVDEIGGRIVVSDHSGQISDLVRDAIEKDPTTHAVIYGGDGTMFEAVNGLMRSGKNDTAVISVIPSGSGNDFSKLANDYGVIKKGETKKIDLVKTTCGGKVRYFDNMMNIGFDCNVVHETEKIRNGGIIKGSAAYIAGVAKVLGVKKTISPTITLEGVVDISSGKELGDLVFENEILLTACANGKYCGGGFKAAPLAKLDDGYMDVLVISNVTRAKFVSLVKFYHDGTYIHGNGKLKPKFEGIIRYIRCKKMTVDGIERFCLDGEIFETNGEPVVAEIAHCAVNYQAI